MPLDAGAGVADASAMTFLYNLARNQTAAHKAAEGRARESIMNHAGFVSAGRMTEVRGNHYGIAEKSTKRSLREGTAALGGAV